jgi:hypothetical protein
MKVDKCGLPTLSRERHEAESVATVSGIRGGNRIRHTADASQLDQSR